MCHSAGTNPCWAPPQKFNGQLKPSSLKRCCRQHCGALASAQQHVSFSCGTNVLHHPFRYHHWWNGPILSIFLTPEMSRTPRRACTITNQNVSVPWFITQPLNEIIKLVDNVSAFYLLWFLGGKNICASLCPHSLYSHGVNPKALFPARKPLLEDRNYWWIKSES